MLPINLWTFWWKTTWLWLTVAKLWFVKVCAVFLEHPVRSFYAFMFAQTNLYSRLRSSHSQIITSFGMEGKDSLLCDDLS